MRKFKVFLTKRALMFTSVVMCGVMIFVFCIIKIGSTKSINAESIFTVVLDAGHGGRDNGVVGVKTGVKESDLNLEYVNTLKTFFESQNINVILTRSNSQGLYGVATNNFKKKDMLKRKQIIESSNANLVISIHMNYYLLPSAKGTQVYYYSKEKGDYSLGEAMQKSLETSTKIQKCSEILYGDYYLLKTSSMASVIVECGFLSNEEDEKLLLSEEYKNDVCSKIFKGAIGYLLQNG